MQIINKDMVSYNLHIIKSDIFKTVTMKVTFTSPLKKDEVTKRNILSDILLQSSKDYKSRRDLTIKSEELYAADIYTTNNRIGNYLSSSFILQTLSDKYTEAGNLEESIKFISDIIFNPDVTDNKFNDEKLELCIHNANVALDSIKENPSNYSIIRMMEAFDKDGVVSTRMTGYKEDLDLIDSSNLYEYYKNMIKNSYVDILYVES